MQNLKSEGKTITWTNGTGSDVASGKPVFIGKIVGFAMGLIKNTTAGEVYVGGGVIELTKDAPLVITQGDQLFWNVVGQKVTKTSTDLHLGTAFADGASADTKIQVLVAGAKAKGGAYEADVSTANASDLATAQALANALKTKVNNILAALRAAGIMEGA
jgi:predicted RecA/RadA family phage recombinase